MKGGQNRGCEAPGHPRWSRMWLSQHLPSPAAQSHGASVLTGFQEQIQWEVTCKGVWVCPCEGVRGCHGGE